MLNIDEYGSFFTQKCEIIQEIYTYKSGHTILLTRIHVTYNNIHLACYNVGVILRKTCKISLFIENYFLVANTPATPMRFCAYSIQYTIASEKFKC